jgi:hypothetical protein
MWRSRCAGKVLVNTQLRTADVEVNGCYLYVQNELALPSKIQPNCRKNVQLQSGSQQMHDPDSIRNADAIATKQWLMWFLIYPITRSACKTKPLLSDCQHEGCFRSRLAV